jgi:hypothetical protein
MTKNSIEKALVFIQPLSPVGHIQKPEFLDVPAEKCMFHRTIVGACDPGKQRLSHNHSTKIFFGGQLYRIWAD